MKRLEQAMLGDTAVFDPPTTRFSQVWIPSTILSIRRLPSVEVLIVHVFETMRTTIKLADFACVYADGLSKWLSEYRYSQ